MSGRTKVGAGLSLGAVMAVPSAAHAADLTVTNLNDSGSGSLRQAIEDANDDADGDRILFKANLSGEINLTSGPLYIFGGDLEIEGPGARTLAVDGGGSRVMSLLATAYDLPAIDVEIGGLRLRGGNATGPGPFDVGDGGGIISYGDVGLALSQTTISGNTASEDGGGISIFGGGTLLVERSTISGNRAEYGGAIYTDEADLTVINSTVSENFAYNAAGILVSQQATEIRNSTLARNDSGSFAGGVGAYQADVALRGSIVADNTANDDLHDYDATESFSGAFNLIGDLGELASFGSSNLFGQDPKLKPLKDNGGPTDTHAFKKSSSAKNAGPSDAPASDQRGAPRKGQPDIGAYELTKCKGVIVNRVGTSGKDKLKGTKRKDGMLGLGGNDKLKGKKGKDGLCGGRGKDKLIGGPGKDKFNGGPGKDKEIQ